MPIAPSDATMKSVQFESEATVGIVTRLNQIRLVNMKTSSAAEEWISYEIKVSQNKIRPYACTMGVSIETPPIIHPRLLLMLVLIVVLCRQIRHGRVGAALLVRHSVVGIVTHIRHLSRQALRLLGVVGRKRCSRSVDRRVRVQRLLLLNGINRIHAILLHPILHIPILVWLTRNLQPVRIAIVWLPRDLEAWVGLVREICGIVCHIVRIAASLSRWRCHLRWGVGLHRRRSCLGFCFLRIKTVRVDTRCICGIRIVPRRVV